MAIKNILFVVACSFHVTVMAAVDDLAVPPVMAPEDFDQTFVKPTGELSLRQAIALTLKHNPELASYAWNAREKEIKQIEAGLLPNPQLGIEVENFAGSGDVSGIKSSETTIALSQLIELGDKRLKRQKIAANDYSLARWDYEIKRIDLLAETARAFIAVLGKQEMLAITKEINGLANDVYSTVSKRVAAGKASKLEEIKARVELSKTRLDSINTEKQLQKSQQSLATLWGDSEITFTDLLGDINQTTAPPDLNTIVDNINHNPDMARWVSEISREQNSINLARAQTIPDVTVSAGMRHLNASDDIAAVASISIPLFIFNNKQTGVRRSEAGLGRAIKQRETSELKIRSALMQNYQQLKILYGEVSVLKDELIPAAEEAFVASRKIYQLGKLDLLGLLDAQRTYFDVRKQYIESLSAYQLMVITIERLIGGGLETFQQSS